MKAGATCEISRLRRRCAFQHPLQRLMNPRKVPAAAGILGLAAIVAAIILGFGSIDASLVSAVLALAALGVFAWFMRGRGSDAWIAYGIFLMVSALASVLPLKDAHEALAVLIVAPPLVYVVVDQRSPFRR